MPCKGKSKSAKYVLHNAIEAGRKRTEKHGTRGRSTKHQEIIQEEDTVAQLANQAIKSLHNIPISALSTPSLFV